MAPKNQMLRMMSLRDFRLLFIGPAMSLLGDQFTLIATPWLTLQLTDDPLALGFVLALEGIPRAAIMLFGWCYHRPFLAARHDVYRRYHPLYFDKLDGLRRVHRHYPDLDAIRLQPRIWVDVRV